jgi:hypothetical protein
VVWDVLVAPRSAFEALRERPQWVWAFALTCALGMAGAVLEIPAGAHVAAATIADQATHDPNTATLSPDQIAAMTRYQVGMQRWFWLGWPLVVLTATSFAALLMLGFDRMTRGRSSFAKFFALATNVAILNYGVGLLVIGLLSALRSPEDFSAPSDIARLTPSLAWLAPGASPKVTALLVAFNPFQIWSFVLLGLGLRTIAGFGRAGSYIVASAVVLAGLLFPVLVAR